MNMEYYNYDITIELDYDIDRPFIASQVTQEFLEKKPGTRVNSIGIYEEHFEDENKTILHITVEYE